MKTLIFLDDERHFQDVSWLDYQQEFAMVLIYRTAQSFIEAISGLEKIDDFVFSFDHDLQSFDQYGQEQTGYDCVKALCDQVLQQEWDPKLLQVFVHSKNPVGRENIEQYVKNFIRHCG